jgi:hypothetical protein
MTFRALKSLFVRPQPTTSRSGRKVSFVVDTFERRISMSGMAAGSALIQRFNPQPDPPSVKHEIIAI